MRSPDQEARSLSRVLLDAVENGMVPARTVRACRVLPPSASKCSAFTLDEARQWLGIDLAIFEQEHARYFSVQRILAGARPAGACQAGAAGSRRPSGRGSSPRSEPL